MSLETWWKVVEVLERDAGEKAGSWIPENLGSSCGARKPGRF
jgi:hypothetical protein